MKNLLLLLLLLLPSPAWATLAIDGGVVAAGTSVTLTTSNANDVIIVWTKYTSGSVTGVTSSHLTFTKRFSTGVLIGGGFGAALDEWYAVASSPLTSEVITIAGGPGSQSNIAFGITGANTASPYDSNVSVPVNSAIGGTPASVTISTSNANDMIITAVCNGSTTGFGTITTPSGFTQITTGSFSHSDFLIVSSTQSSVTETYSWTSGNTGTIMAADAIKAAGGVVSPPQLLNILD